MLKAADEYLRFEAVRKQEAEDLKLFDNCPPAGSDRFEKSLPQIACALDRNSTASNGLSVAAVEALSKMSTARRATFLRWAVEHEDRRSPREGSRCPGRRQPRRRRVRRRPPRK